MALGTSDVEKAKDAARDDPDLSQLYDLLMAVGQVVHVDVFCEDDRHLDTYIEVSFRREDKVGRGTDDAITIAQRAGWQVREVVWARNWIRFERAGGDGVGGRDA